MLPVRETVDDFPCLIADGKVAKRPKVLLFSVVFLPRPPCEVIAWLRAEDSEAVMSGTAHSHFRGCWGAGRSVFLSLCALCA